MIAALEDAMITALQNALGTHVREVTSLPGPWSLDLLRRLLQRAPSCYVSWLGGQAGGGNFVSIDSRVDVIVVTKNARGETARRRGGPVTMGAYDIIETILPALHDRDMGGLGTLALMQVQNVFNEATFELGATVYAAQFRIPCEIDASLPANLGNFATFHQDVDMAPADGQIDISETDSLPQ